MKLLLMSLVSLPLLFVYYTLYSFSPPPFIFTCTSTYQQSIDSCHCTTTHSRTNAPLPSPLLSLDLLLKMASLDHSEATRTVEEPLSIHPNDSQSPLTEKVSSDSTAGSGKPGDDINKSSRKPGNGNKVTLAGEPPLRSSTLDSYPPGRSSRRGTRENSGGNANPNDSEAFDLPPLKKRITSLFASERKIKREPSWAESGKAIVKASWLNVLLVFIPVSSISYSCFFFLEVIRTKRMDRFL